MERGWRCESVRMRCCVCDQTERLLTSPLGSGPSSGAASCQETETSVAKTHTLSLTLYPLSLCLSLFLPQYESLFFESHISFSFPLCLPPSGALDSLSIPLWLPLYHSLHSTISLLPPLLSRDGRFSLPPVAVYRFLLPLLSTTLYLIKTCPPPASLCLSHSHLTPRYVCYNRV